MWWMWFRWVQLGWDAPSVASRYKCNRVHPLVGIAVGAVVVDLVAVAGVDYGGDRLGVIVFDYCLIYYYDYADGSGLRLW